MLSTVFPCVRDRKMGICSRKDLYPSRSTSFSRGENVAPPHVTIAQGWKIDVEKNIAPLPRDWELWASSMRKVTTRMGKKEISKGIDLGLDRNYNEALLPRTVPSRFFAFCFSDQFWCLGWWEEVLTPAKLIQTIVESLLLPVLISNEDLGGHFEEQIMQCNVIQCNAMHFKLNEVKGRDLDVMMLFYMDAEPTATAAVAASQSQPGPRPPSSTLLTSLNSSSNDTSAPKTRPRPKPLTVTFSDFHPISSTIKTHPNPSTSPPKVPSSGNPVSTIRIISSPLPQNLSDSSLYNSPTNISPASSAFVSASQSPFLSPNASGLLQLPNEERQQSPFSQSTSHSDDVPSSSYTPPPENNLKSALFEDFSDDIQKSKTQTISPSSDLAPPRVSFSFPVPRVSFARGSVSPTSGRLRSCDVYIGIHGQNSSLLRFSKWLRAEFELQGIACFAADRARYSDTQSHDIADRIICSATFGVLIITKNTFINPFGIEEIRVFLQRKNLIPIFFDVAQSDCLARDIIEKKGELWEKHGGELWRLCEGQEKEWREAVEGLGRVQEWKLEAYKGNWRNCILRAVSLLGSRLGRRSVAERERVKKERVEDEEFPFPRNTGFVGREKELKEIENILFGRATNEEEDIQLYCFRKYEKDKWHESAESFVPRRRSDADGWSNKKGLGLTEGYVERRKSDSDRWVRQEGKKKEADALKSRGGKGHLDIKKCKEPTLEAWIEPPLELQNRGRSPPKQRAKLRAKHKHKEKNSRPEHGHLSYGSGIACIHGVSGIGKTELALEFAYRFSQRYRMVLWVGGEARYLRQNFLNLSLFLGLDVSSETQMCPEKGGRIRTFEEQELEALQRVRRELLRDVPYLLVIDNLESEKDWWDGRDVLELLPRINGATHVIITTRLPRVMSLEPLELSYLSRVEAMFLMKGKRDFSSQDLDALRSIEEKLGRLTFGLGIVGALLSELSITPSALLEAINKVPLRESTWGIRDDPTLKNNAFLMQLLGVCFSILNHANKPRNLASKMAWVGGWFAPAPIPVSVLASAAHKVSAKQSGLYLWKKCLRVLCWCCLASQTRRWDAEAVALLLRFGIAKKTSRQGWIQFHEIIQAYARKKGGIPAAKAMAQGIKKRGTISLHPEHFWAACFLMFGFGNDPMIVEFKVMELISFIKREVLPLAVRAFTAFSRCHASLELLRLCTNALEEVEKSFVSQIQDWCDKSLCCKKGIHSGYQVDEYAWQDVTLLKAFLLETRAKLMLRGGQFDAGEELCRTCISIRTVMLGHDHPQTLAAQETLAKLVRYRSKI
eukprot:Gb_07382 [translate_table: standard]